MKLELKKAKKIVSECVKAMKLAVEFLEKDSINVDLKECEIEAFEILIHSFEQLEKENEELKIERDGYRTQVNSAFDKGFIHKEKMREQIEDQIKRINKFLEDMVDKSTGGINVTYLSKKEKEEVIVKRNSLVVQKATLQQVKEEFLKGE